MKLVFATQASEDYLYWQKRDPKMAERIDAMIKETQREPYKGAGRPSRLKHALAGFWSRRFAVDQRMVYKVKGNVLMVAALRYHY